MSTKPEDVCELATHQFKVIEAAVQRPLEAPSLFSLSDVRRHVVDLDGPPEERWKHVVAMYRDHLPGVLSLVSDLLGGGAVETLATSFLSVLASSAVAHVAYAAELRGVAEAAGLSVGHVVAMQVWLIPVPSNAHA